MSTLRDQNPETQLAELRAYVARRGWVVVEEYVDRGISGAKDRRPALDRLMADARRRKIDAVAVWKFDRFARSLKHLVTALDEFRALGVEFVSLTEAIDTTTSIGRVLFGVLASIGEFERDLIRERVKAGLARAKSEGKRIGRPAALLDLAKARALIAGGDSLRAAARALGTHHRTLARALAVEKAHRFLTDFGPESSGANPPSPGTQQTLADAGAAMAGERGA